MTKTWTADAERYGDPDRVVFSKKRFCSGVSPPLLLKRIIQREYLMTH